MDKRQQPIGVFDSGVGGISVLRELVALMPNENYIFYGDSKNAPYGTKDVEIVRRLSYADASYLLARGAKALVVACNTATSAAVAHLRRDYPNIPVIGIEPALKPAVYTKDYPRVLVMATPMTLREEKFHQLMSLYEEKAEIIPMPCPGLVEFVERGELNGPQLERFLEQLFVPYYRKKIDALVLGCTHYPFVKQTIQKVIGEETIILDGGAGTARETRHRLEEKNLLNPSNKRGSVILENSLKSEEILKLSRQLMGIY